MNPKTGQRLKADLDTLLWHAAYESNMKKLIPVFAKQLHEDELPINGVKQRGLWRRR